MSYVDTYLTFQPRDKEGWPSYVDEDAKKWCIGSIKSLMKQYPNGIGIYWVNSHLFRSDDRPDCMRGVSVYDAQYALTHRALLAANCEKVWRLA